MRTRRVLQTQQAKETDNAAAALTGRQKWLPVIVILSPWPVMLLLYYFGPIAFRPLQLATFAYLAAAGALLLLGYQIGWLTLRIRRHPPLAPSINANGFRVLVLVSLVASVVLLLDSLRSGFSFDLLLNDPVQGRVLQAAHVTSFLTTISFPFAVLSYSAFLFGITRHAMGERDKGNLLAVAAILPLLLANALQAGRQTFLITGLLLLSWFVLFYGNRPLRQIAAVILKRAWIVLPIVTIVIVYFFFIAVRRHDVDTLTLDTWMRMGNLSPRAADLAPSSGNEDLLIGGYSGVYYYTHQLQALDTIIGSGLPAEGFGRGVLGWILLQLTRTGVDLTYNDIPVQAAMYLRGENMSGWRTGFSTLISDFGISGSLAFVLIISILLGRFVRSACVERTDAHLLAATWLVAASIFMIQFFPSDGVFTANLLLIVFLRFRRSQARVRRTLARPRSAIDRSTALLSKDRNA